MKLTEKALEEAMRLVIVERCRILKSSEDEVTLLSHDQKTEINFKAVKD